MKTPKGLLPLLEDGIIDTVLRQLQSGKEAAVYVVSCGDKIRCAKVYKEVQQRSFKHAVEYTEGRKARGSRNARAAGKNSRYGRKVKEVQWKNAEVDALHRLANAGVRVPQSHGVFDGVLLMELITDADGQPAPRLSDVHMVLEEAVEWHEFMIRQIVIDHPFYPSCGHDARHTKANILKPELAIHFSRYVKKAFFPTQNRTCNANQCESNGETGGPLVIDNVVGGIAYLMPNSVPLRCPVGALPADGQNSLIGMPATWVMDQAVNSESPCSPKM